MDHAVALVQAYLHVNGYFTITEFPVLSALPGGGYASATDVDLLALRLCGAGGLAAAGGADASFGRPLPDPALAVPKAAADLLLVEVKEGRAQLNAGAKHPRVLEAIFDRIGVAPHDAPEGALAELDRTGETTWPGDVRVRMLAFGSVVDPAVVRGFRAISLVHATRYLTDYLEANWDMLRHAQIRHEALGFLALLEQIRRTPPPGAEDAAGPG